MIDGARMSSAPIEGMLGLVITIIAFPALIWLGANSVVGRGPWRAFFTWLGTALYVVYILQVPVLIFVSRVLHLMDEGTQACALAPAA